VETADIISTVSAAIAAAGFTLAVIQYRGVRRQRQTDSERLATQGERLQNATSTAYLIFEMANAIVQSAKLPDTTLKEIQRAARDVRGTAGVLAQQLQDERKQIDSWQKTLMPIKGGWTSLGGDAGLR
jgi:Flp pilus assembly protein TadB